MIEAVEGGDPVIQVTTRERPVDGERGEVLRQLVQRDVYRLLDKVADERRLDSDVLVGCDELVVCE